MGNGSVEVTHNFFYAILIGTKTTLEVSFSSLLIGLALGLCLATAELQPSPLRYISYSWNLLIRGLPEIFVIFACYYGVTLLLTTMVGHYVDVNAFGSGVVALSIIFAAYASQILIAAYHAIPQGERLAAKSLALSPITTLIKIILPQLWRHALPGLLNLWLILLKDSSIVSLIGLKEIMSATHVAAAESFKPFTYYLFAALIYLSLTSLSSMLSQFIEKRFHDSVTHA